MRWAVLSWAVVLGVFAAACGESHGGANGANGSSGNAGTGGAASNGGGAGGGEASGASTGAGRGGSSGGNTGGSTTAGTAAMPGAGTLGTAGSMSGAGDGGVSAGGAGAVGAMGGSGAAAGMGGGEESPDVTVRLEHVKQSMVGFGIGNPLGRAMTNEEAGKLFSTSTGLGLSILRIFIGSNGLPGLSTAYNDIVLAKAAGASIFIAAARTAPASCKDNLSENDGGHLLTDCYDEWASKLAAFPALVKTNADAELYGLAIQNEPDFGACGVDQPCNGRYATMVYTASELVNFVKVLGPKMRNGAPDVKIMGPETREWLHLWSNMSAPGSTDPLGGTGYDYGHALYDDPTAWSFIDIISTHQYDTLVAEPWPSDVPQTKSVWMNEASGQKYWPEEGPSIDIGNAVAVAGWIHDALVNGNASAWLYFTHQSEFTDDNEGLVLEDGRVAKRFYTLGNFSRYIRPNYVRVNVSGVIPAAVLVSAYKYMDGSVVVVAINQGDSPVSLPIHISDAPVPETMTPHVTSPSDDLAERNPVVVSGGAFVAELAAMSVTTFVGGGE